VIESSSSSKILEFSSYSLRKSKSTCSLFNERVLYWCPLLRIDCTSVLLRSTLSNFNTVSYWQKSKSAIELTFFKSRLLTSKCLKLTYFYKASLNPGKGTSLTNDKQSFFKRRWFAISNIVSVKSLCQMPYKFSSTSFLRYLGNLIGVIVPVLFSYKMKWIVIASKLLWREISVLRMSMLVLTLAFKF
jgi:hypothetical protein